MLTCCASRVAYTGRVLGELSDSVRNRKLRPAARFFLTSIGNSCSSNRGIYGWLREYDARWHT